MRKVNRSRILSISITFAIVLILVLIPQAEALKTEITEPSPKILGASINFSIKITIEGSEILPIQSVKLQIRNVDNATYSLSCENLPLVEENKTYSTNGGTLIVRAMPEENWQYGYGYGYASWENVGYYWGYGYGYGYGHGGVWGVGPTSITYNITWNSPSTWPSGNYRISVDIIANGTTFTKSRTVALERAPAAPPAAAPPAPVYGVSTSISPSYSSGLAGTRLTYIMTVTNTGNASDIYSLTTSDNAGWSPSVSSTSLSLAAGESGIVTLSVTIPENAENCTRDNIISTATSQRDPAVRDNSSCIAHAWFGYKVEVSVSPSESSGAPGTTLTFTVSIINSGAFVDNYDLTASDNAGWRPALSENSLKNMEPNENRTVTLSVTIPENAENCTRDNIISTATSLTDITVSDSGTCVAHAEITLPAARFELSNLVIRPAAVLAGDTVTISIMVTNVGDLSGDYTMILRIDGAIEAAQTVTVDAGASETVTFTVVRTEARAYGVEINELFGSFTVSAPPPTAWIVLVLAVVAIIPVVLILWKKLWKR